MTPSKVDESKPDAPTPTKEELERCTGTYAADAGLSMTVSLGGPGCLMVAGGGQNFPLEALGGARFRIVGQSSYTLEFGGGGSRYTNLTLNLGGRVMHFVRKD